MVNDDHVMEPWIDVGWRIKATLREKDLLERVFAANLAVRVRGAHLWTFGMTWMVIDLVGLENLVGCFTPIA